MQLELKAQRIRRLHNYLSCWQNTGINQLPSCRVIPVRLRAKIQPRQENFQKKHLTITIHHAILQP